MRTRWLAALAAGIASAAYAGPPMLTDDPETPGDRQWEVNVAYNGAIRGGERIGEWPTLDMAYGIGETMQIKAESAYIGRTADGVGTSGLGRTKIGVKWRFVDTAGWLVSIYPQYGAALQPKNVAKGLVDAQNVWIMPIEIMKKAGPWSVVLEGGYGSDPQRDRLQYGLMGAYRPADRIELLAELWGQTSVAGGKIVQAENIGMRYAFLPGFSLLLSAGRLHEAAAPWATIFYTGIQSRF